MKIKIKSTHLSYLGGILFLVGLNIMFYAYYSSFPITISNSIDELTFYQFHSSYWVGMVCCLIGLFVAGYFSHRKSVKLIAASFFPVILFSYVFFYSYLSSSDSGFAKSMFVVFHQVGIEPDIITYFQYPSYFTLNEISSQMLGLNVNGIAILFFIVYGILLGGYLFLFLSKSIKVDASLVAFLAIPIYFTESFSYLNYQWVPQTLALVFLFLLLCVYKDDSFKYRLLTVIIFIALVFSHAFIPVIFLMFFGLMTIRERKYSSFFLLLLCIYLFVLIYYTTYFLDVILDAFEETLYGFGGEYVETISERFKENTGVLDQTISLVNRIRIPLTGLVISLGFFVLFVKKKISLPLTLLLLAGVFYLGIGMYYSVLGLRALQIVFIPLIVGIGVFTEKYRKVAPLFVILILVLSIAGPMRATYDQTRFQMPEQENASLFFVSALPNTTDTRIGIGQVDWGYFFNMYLFMRGENPRAIRPGNEGFTPLINGSLEPYDFILYNTNFGKEVKFIYGLSMSNITEIIADYQVNNKIYSCGTTSILSG